MLTEGREAGQYVEGELGRGFESLLVITLSSTLWFPKENKDDEEN